MKKHKAWDVFGIVIIGIASIPALYLLICHVLAQISYILNS